MSEQPDIAPDDPPAEPEAQAAVQPALPGRTLREAREAKALTVADIAQALKFSPRQIEALEADDFAALPGVTFVRGAVRSYAKFLKLDALPLLSMLDAIVPVAAPDVRPPQNMGTALSAKGVRQVSPLVAASVLLMIVAVVIGVWHSLGRSQPDVAASAAPAVQGGEVVAVPAPAVQPEAQVDQPPPVAAPTPVPASAVAAPAPAVTAPAPAAAPPAPAPGLRQLVFVFSDKSWLEVRDAQQTLFSGERLAGSRETIAGKPPFQIVIGNATKVQLLDGDREVDLKPYTRAEVARLTLQ